MKKILLLVLGLLIVLGPTSASAAGIRIYYPNKPPVVAKTAKAVINPLPKKVVTQSRVEPVLTLTAAEIKQLVAAEVQGILDQRETENTNKATTVSLNQLSAFNDNYDPEQPGFQPYYIGGGALTDSGTFFGATNIGADSLTGNSAEISSLSVSDEATFENGMQVNGPLHLSGSDELDNTIIDSDSGAFLSTGGVWTNASSKTIKENFTPLDPEEMLKKVNSLAITRWNYKNESPEITHIGPMAEDFAATFEVGGTAGQTAISTIDPAGIALAAIQAISQKFDTNLTWLTRALEQLGVTIENQVVKLHALVVGSPEQPTGITLYDRSTTQPYCVSIDNGTLQTTLGTCVSGSGQAAPTPESTASPSDVPELTPPTEEALPVDEITLPPTDDIPLDLNNELSE